MFRSEVTRHGGLERLHGGIEDVGAEPQDFQDGLDDLILDRGVLDREIELGDLVQGLHLRSVATLLPRGCGA